MRVVITRVLPVPAPARTSSGPSVVVTASRCAGLSLASREVSPWDVVLRAVEEEGIASRQRAHLYHGSGAQTRRGA